MNTFTPSSTSSVVAGAGFWMLLWSIVWKMDRLTAFFGVRTHWSDKIIRFVRKEKVLSLSCTEAFNYTVHGITNPLSVMFALGGTFVNVLMIFIVVPFCCLFKK